MHDLAVVGTGIVGAPAAMHAAHRGASVVAIGAPEPENPGRHRGLFGAWHDVSRLLSVGLDDPDDRSLVERTVASIHRLQEGEPAPLLTEVGYVYAASPGIGRHEGELDAAALTALAGGAVFPDDVTGRHEGPPAGHLDPRRLVAAQLAAARTAGAEVISAEVEAVDIAGDHVTVRIAGGRQVRARAALLATGAFSNRPAFLPRPLALHRKTETVLHAELDDDPYPDMPVIHFDIDSPAVGAIYTVPPLRHPDGRLMMKFGANTRHDRRVSTPIEIGGWYREGASDVAIDDMAAECARMFPALRGAAWHTARCVITYTPHGYPIVDSLVPGRLFCAVGGNGSSARWGDAIGDLAAGLALTGDWADPVDPGRFRAEYDDEHPDWRGPPLIGEG